MAHKTFNPAETEAAGKLNVMREEEISRVWAAPITTSDQYIMTKEGDKEVIKDDSHMR
jgi:hypothetical protein